MGVDRETLRTPLLDTARGGDTEAGDPEDMMPPTEDPLLPHETSGVVKRNQAPNSSSLDTCSNGGEEEGNSNQNHPGMTALELRMLFVYAQWIWPSLVFSGLTNIYDGNGGYWFASMVGNALLLAILWWITAAESNDANNHAKIRHRQLGRTDILPTVVWAILPPLSALLYETPEATIMLLLAILIPLPMMMLLQCHRYGCYLTMDAFVKRCGRHFERCFPLKRLEEEYYEDLRKHEDEELKKLEDQQERLSYLEKELGSSNGKKKHSRWIICILFVCCAEPVCFALHLSIVLLPKIAPVSLPYLATDPHLAPKARLAPQLINRKGTLNHNLVHSSPKEFKSEVYVYPDKDELLYSGNEKALRIITNSNWEGVLSETTAVFVHFHAPWSSHCRRLAPAWKKFAREVHEHESYLPLVVGSVNCVEEKELCRKENVMAFPTLRWFQNGERTDYKMDRTVEALIAYSTRKFSMTTKIPREW